MATLGDTFAKAVDLYAKIDTSPMSSNDPSFQAMVAQAVTLFTDCMKMVRDLTLFSTNESLEDIATRDLQFLLVEAYLGDLVPKVAGDDRLRLLERAKSHWIGFMTTLENYGLLSDEHRTYYKRIMEGATVPSGSAKRREDVIARHKRKQKLEEDIQTLRDRKARGVEADEEVERELSLANIASFTELALENLEMVDQEMILLRGREKAMSRSTGASQAAPPLEAFQRPALNGPLLSAEGKPLKTFTLVNDRQAMQKKVFGPGHSLPTMSIDEYLERERERGNIISGGGQGSAARPEKAIIDDNDEAAVDMDTYKKREWDDWKDDHPRGYGNRKGKG